jgi:hypothetical protein
MAGYISPQELERRKRQQEEEAGLSPFLFGAARRAAIEARKSSQSGRALPIVEREMPGSQFLSPTKREQSRMSSDANIDKDRIGKGSFTAKTPPKRATKPPVTRNTASEYVAPPSPESALTAGIQGLPGGQSGVSQEAGSDYGRTTYFGETPEAATQIAQQMRKGLFGEDISQEDYDAMTQRNKDASFFGRFKKGGQVKKKTAKKASGGSVSSASKRGDGCCQRGKTKGRMV